MKRNFKPFAPILLSLALLLGVSSCSTNESSSDQEISSEVKTKVENLEEDKVSELRLKVTILPKPDKAEFLRKVQRRLDYSIDFFEVEALLNYGTEACKISNGYITGSVPGSKEELVKYLLSSGVSDEIAKELAYATLNASRNTICTVEYQSLE